jgi:hypothetical protein
MIALSLPSTLCPVPGLFLTNISNTPIIYRIDYQRILPRPLSAKSQLKALKIINFVNRYDAHVSKLLDVETHTQTTQTTHTTYTHAYPTYKAQTDDTHTHTHTHVYTDQKTQKAVQHLEAIRFKSSMLQKHVLRSNLRLVYGVALRYELTL